jgi:hypothetical protein
MERTAQHSVESLSWIYKMRFSSLHDQDSNIAVHETYMQGVLRCKCKGHATWPGAQATSRALRSAERACDCEQKPSAAVQGSVLSVLCCAVVLTHHTALSNDRPPATPDISGSAARPLRNLLHRPHRNNLWDISPAAKAAACCYCCCCAARPTVCWLCCSCLAHRHRLCCCCCCGCCQSRLQTKWYRPHGPDATVQ